MDKVEQIVSRMGLAMIAWLSDLGQAVLFMKEVLRQSFVPPYRWSAILEQLEFIGNRSLGIILLTSFFTGAVFGLQIGDVFSIFKAESIMGAATAKALTREMGPLMCAFLLSGRAGSSITAEIATMKVNEQIDAMEAMSVDPINYLCVPRLIAFLIAMPLLCGVFIFVGVFGAYIVGIFLFNVDVGIFIDRIKGMVRPPDIFSGLEKAAVFAGIIALISCRFGMLASEGAKGVGLATTNSVVTTLLVVLCFDVVITYIQLFVMV